MLTAFVASAQTGYELGGIITDSVTNLKLDYVTVGLKTEKNEPVKSVLTRDDGSFLFSDIKPGKYVLTVVAMGYRTKATSINLTDKTDIGEIRLAPQSTNLSAVVVMADKPLVKMDVDKLSYDLQADPESKVNSVLDMMRKVPMLSLDHEENIQMKGSGNYRIMINGKPSAMLERDPKEILRSMPASTIQSIEVITNPPSKYDGEGLVGIINIVTIKNVDNGYNGNLNFNQRFPSGGPNLGSSINFKQGKWGVSANMNGMLFFDPSRTSVTDRETSGLEISSLRQDGDGEYRSRNANARLQLSYDIDSLNLVSGQYAYSLGRYNGAGYLNSNFLTPGFNEYYYLQSESNGSRNSTDAALNYQMGFKRNKQTLVTVSYRYLRYFNDSGNDVVFSNRINYNLPDYRQFNEGGTTEQTVQFDYVQPIRKLTMETGVKGIFRSGNSNFNYHAKNGAGNYVLVPAFTNQFENEQDVYSFYNSWQLSAGNWGIKGGFRLEHTRLYADFISSNTKLDRNYLNWLPTVSLSRNFKNKSSVGFGFSQRIQRPGIWDMNPFVDRSNPNLERSGNPGLRPVVANNFQLTYNRSGKTSISVGLSHSFIDNAIQYGVLYDESANVNRLIMSNTGKNKTTGMNLNIGQPLSSKWNMNFTTNLNYVFVTGFVDGKPAENDGFKGNFALSTSYRFNRGWRANANMNYLLTPEVLLQGEGIAIFFSGASVSKDLFKEKLSISGSVNNPFNKFMFFPNYIRGANYNLLVGGQGYFRAFSYSLNYKFGKLKGQISKNKREINNDDSL